MTRKTLLALAPLGFVALTAGTCTVQQEQAAAEVVQVVAPFLPSTGKTLLAAGQLVCGLAPIFDQLTGAPVLVTGKTADAVQALCRIAGTGAPGPAPAGAILTAKAIVLP